MFMCEISKAMCCVELAVVELTSCTCPSNFAKGEIYFRAIEKRKKVKKKE